VVAGDRLVPQPIDHPKLFQPVPRPVPRLAVEDVQPAAPRSPQGPAVEPAAPYVILASQGGGGFSLGPRRLQPGASPFAAPGDTASHALGLVEAALTSSHAFAPAERAHRGGAAPLSDHAVVVVTSAAPLRILVTRRTARHRLIGVQYVLSSMGFLTPQKFDGTFGKATAAAIKAFQRAHDLPESAALTDNLIHAVYEAAGKEVPPEGHLFVRQNFSRLFDVPMTIRDPGEPLGTHIFTAMSFAPGDSKAEWTAISLEGEGPARALSRIEIPSEARRRIAARLTPG